MKVLLHKTVLVVGTSLWYQLFVAVKDLGFRNQFPHLHITLINSSSSDPYPVGQMLQTHELLPRPL